MKKLLEYLKNKGILFATWFGISNPWGSDEFTTIEGAAGKASEVISFAINVSGLVAVVVIIYGAYLMITSAGDPEMFETGYKAIQAAIIGLVVVFLSYLIISFLIQNGIVGIAGLLYV